MVGGTPRPDHYETIDVGWFGPAELSTADLAQFARSMFGELGILDGD